ncbi:hypothetical protein PJP10_21090 [Mycobacterium kansasii]
MTLAGATGVTSAQTSMTVHATLPGVYQVVTNLRGVTDGVPHGDRVMSRCPASMSVRLLARPPRT